MRQRTQYNVNAFFDRPKNLLAIVFLLMGIWMVPTARGQNQAPSASGQAPSSSGQFAPSGGQIISGNGAYRIGPTDILKVTVLKQDLLTQDGVRVDYDGNIRLPMLTEPVHAACLTEGELASLITEQYRKYLLNPQVFVTILQFNANSISVIGAVTSPGRFQLQGPVRLLQVLALVNGPSASASEELQILRTSTTDYCGEKRPDQQSQPYASSEPELIVLRMKDIMSGSLDANPVLRGGDIIRVATADLKQAFVIGNVRTAATINLKEPVMLSTAIAMAGGPVAGAQLEKIKITRQSAESLKKSDIFVNLKEIRSGAKPDILLAANDVIDVPGPSGTKKFFKNILQTLVPFFSGVPVIIP